MYRFAYKYSDDVIFYFDSAGNKYVATGGNLAWRINNPGLVSSHSHFSRANGAIGSWEHYIKQRTTHYENEFSKISNPTILDPDPDSKFKHKLDS